MADESQGQQTLTGEPVDSESQSAQERILEMYNSESLFYTSVGTSLKFFTEALLTSPIAVAMYILGAAVIYIGFAPLSYTELAFTLMPIWITITLATDGLNESEPDQE